MVTQAAINVTVVIMGFFTLYFIIKRIMKKPKKKQDKKWVVLEHEESENGKATKCYFVQNKKSQKKSPCFKEKQNLNKWLNENAIESTQG